MAELSYIGPRIIDGLKILQKYWKATEDADDPNGLILTENHWGTHSQIIVQVDPDKVSKKDKKRLEEMGWGDCTTNWILVMPKDGGFHKEKLERGY